MKTRHQSRLCFFISDNKMTEWDRMTERDSGPQVSAFCNVLSVVIVSCKLCCLNAVSKRKTLPSLASAHTRAAACLLRLYSLVNWNWLQLAVLEHGDKTGRLVATIRHPVYAHLSHWIWFKWRLNLSAAVISISSYWLTHNWEEILPTVGCVVSSAKYWAINAVLQSKFGCHLVGPLTLI